jgi:hypothetical protein
MQNPLAFSLWAGVVVYAAATVVGVIVFYGSSLNKAALTEGYGVGFRIAVSDTVSPGRK